MFVFQACYGTEPWYNESNINFRVVSADDGKPIEGVSLRYRWERPGAYSDWQLKGYTDDNGKVEAWVIDEPNLSNHFLFKDQDSIYAVKDTVINHILPDTIEIVLTKVGDAK